MSRANKKSTPEKPSTKRKSESKPESIDILGDRVFGIGEQLANLSALLYDHGYDREHIKNDCLIQGIENLLTAFSKELDEISNLIHGYGERK